MKWLKKIATTPMAKNIGMIINSLTSGDDKTVNAPSIQAVLNGMKANVIDNLNSNDSEKSLSAKQGNVLKQLISEATEKNVITLKLYSDYNVEGDMTNEQLSLSTYKSVGNKLTLENGAVKIGSNVSNVKVSATVLFNTNFDGTRYREIVIRKNNSTIALAECHVTSNSILNLTDCIAEVSSGDVLSLWVRTAQNDVVYGTNSNLCKTYMTVEAI